MQTIGAWRSFVEVLLRGAPAIVVTTAGLPSRSPGQLQRSGLSVPDPPGLKLSRRAIQQVTRRQACVTRVPAANIVGCLVPKTQDQAEQHELCGVVTAIDCPQFSAALGELVVDAKARCDHAEAGHQPA